MAKPPYTKASHRRSVDTHGQDVTHRTYSSSGTDSYGDPNHSSSTSTVTARVRHVRTPELIRGPEGDDVDVDVEIYVKDDLTVTDLDEGDGRPDEFTADGVDYVVVNAETQDNGLLNCRCVRK